MRGGVRSVVLVLVLALGVAACPSEPEAAPPAPTPAPPVIAAKPEAPAAPPVVVHAIAEGETLWDIARAYSVPVEAIMRENKLGPDDVRRLQKGASLRIPGASAPVHVETATDRAAAPEVLPTLTDGAYHRLATGESVWTLARDYDVPIEQIMERNAMTDQDIGRLQIGQAIVIPGIQAGQIRKPVPSTPSVPARRDGVTHTLVEGETIWDIAREFKVSVAEIMATNALSESAVRTLRDGTELFLPGVEKDRRGQVRRRESAREVRATGAARRLGLGTVRAAGMLLHGRVEKRWIAAAVAAGGGPRLPGTLRWPVANGWFVRGYGSGEGGYHLATDIMGEIGWNVRAAAPGIVGYSGDGVRGFGNVVLVIHPGGWVTLYAHNSVNFVAAGETVSRGSILAEVGSTGISRGPHVHFELIHGGKNCDPSSLFRPGTRHRSGKVSSASQASWTDPEKRPREVRCAPRRRHPRSRWVEHENPEEDAAPAQ